MILIILSSLFLLYWLVSLTLLMMPRLLHKRRMTPAKRRLLKPGAVANFAHRAGGLEQYEQSVTAFKHCLKLGVNGIEIDTHRTKDGVFVVSHDDNLKRLTNQDSKIMDINYADIKPFVSTLLTDFDEPYTENNERGESLATLEQCFQIYKGSDVLINIDVKTDKLDDIDAVINMAKKYDLLQNIIIGSIADFCPDDLKSKHSHDVNFFFPEKRLYITIFLFMIGLLPFLDIKYDFFEPTAYFKTVIKSRIFAGMEYVHSILWFFDFMRPVITLMNWHLEQRNIVVLYWTLNHEEDYDLAITLGANGIIGDRPTEIKEYLQKRGILAK